MWVIPRVSTSPKITLPYLHKEAAWRVGKDLVLERFATGRASK